MTSIIFLWIAILSFSGLLFTIYLKEVDVYGVAKEASENIYFGDRLLELISGFELSLKHGIFSVLKKGMEMTTPTVGKVHQHIKDRHESMVNTVKGRRGYRKKGAASFFLKDLSSSKKESQLQ